jgi:hypothetical protein
MEDTNPLRLILLEINEISWELMHPWLAKGELPHFQRLREYGTVAHTMADERPPLLDPWITWTTVYTGVPQTEHGMRFLEQPPETVQAQHLWDLVSQAGKRVGIFGSIGSWPPKPLDGYIIPGGFSPDSRTYPEYLRPIQDLNLRYTRAHSPEAKQPGLGSLVSSGVRLMKHGLNVRTGMAVLKVLIETKLHPDRNWKKVSLQPRINWAFFRRLYERTRPDFATFHTNHVAHYQHRFLRAMNPALFPDPTDESEIRRFGDAIHYGYRVADWLVGQFIRLCEREGNVVLCVASSMGQKPWLSEAYGNIAPLTCRIRSIERLLDILSIRNQCEYFSTMAPQWNLRLADAALRQSIINHLHTARYQPLGKSMYSAVAVEDTIVVTPVSHHGLDSNTTCSFPTLEGAPTFPFDELVLQAEDTRKSGCHDPIGMIAFYGPGIPHELDLGQINTLDVAPTVLTLLGLPVPSYMKGRVWTETTGPAGRNQGSGIRNQESGVRSQESGVGGPSVPLTLEGPSPTTHHSPVAR